MLLLLFNCCRCTKVAEHLSKSYGDKAYKVARLAQLTGKRWPVVGRRLHDDYPYIEAEARPCVYTLAIMLQSNVFVFVRLRSYLEL